MKVQAYRKIMHATIGLITLSLLALIFMQTVSLFQLKKQQDYYLSKTTENLSNIYSNKFIEMGDILYSLEILTSKVNNVWNAPIMNQLESMEISKTLASFMHSKNYISDIVLINKSSDVLLTTGGSTNIDVFFNKKYYNPRYTTEYWRMISSSENRITIVPEADYIDSTMGVKTTGKYAFVVGNTRLYNNKINIMLVIDVERFLELSDEYLTPDGAVFWIFDDQGNMIISSEEQGLENIFNFNSIKNKGSFNSYYSATSKHNDYTYIMHLPYNAMDWGGFWRNTLFVILVYLAFVLIAVFYFYKKIHIKPCLAENEFRHILFGGLSNNTDMQYVLCLAKQNNVREVYNLRKILEQRFKNVLMTYISESETVFLIPLTTTVTRQDILTSLESMQGDKILLVIGNEYIGLRNLKLAYREVIIDSLVYQNGDYRIDSAISNTVAQIRFPREFSDVLLSNMRLNKSDECIEGINKILTESGLNKTDGKYNVMLYYIFMVLSDILLEIGVNPVVVCGYEKEFINFLMNKNIEAVKKSFLLMIEDGCQINIVDKSLNYNFIKNYIDVHYTEPLYLEDIAQVCNTSAKYFSRYFKKTFGINYVEYINRTRLHYAKKHLKLGKYTINEIAGMVGYNNATTFSSTFKKIYGMLPSEYRACADKNDKE